MCNHPECRVHVQNGGIFSTLQDLGRTSGKPYGVTPGGALDRFAHRAANELVGNKPHAATLEMTLRGATLRFEQKALIAITGSDFKPRLNKRPIPMWHSVFVRAGQTLDFAGAEGRLAYLAVHGGWDAPLLMGSRSTNVHARFGGYAGLGRTLNASDILTNANDYLKPVQHLAGAAGHSYSQDLRPHYGKEVIAHIVPGPYLEHFALDSLELLCQASYEISSESERMGYRLKGERALYRGEEWAEIAVCGTVFGTIQVPPDGQPIILMADHQVTGGYPIIGVVAETDLPLIAQLLPGQKVRFKLFEEELI
ncbi:biotin-dependent carboxyltransferase family protein [Candidatus Chlorohelix sp.]|uniref:5-oxoprolinase subunit C family protein n=1 Tax=Candidatus Chlorohelix sp. TaxID=3139201 RepID=UPI00303F6D9C